MDFRTLSPHTITLLLAAARAALATADDEAELKTLLAFILRCEKALKTL